MSNEDNKSEEIENIIGETEATEEPEAGAAEDTVEETAEAGDVEEPVEETATSEEVEKPVEEPAEEAPRKKKRKLPLGFKIAGVIAAVLLVAGGIGAYVGYTKYQAYLEECARIAEEDALVKQQAVTLALDTFHRHAVEDVFGGTGEAVADAFVDAGI